MRRYCRFGLIAFAWLLSAPVHARVPTDTRAAGELAAEALSLAVERTTLGNGLRVVLQVDHTAPTVAVALTYDVGSRNEQPGRSGFAHLFEHIMFQGSSNAPKGAHFKLVSEHGGILNGTTSSDGTNYFEVLPANQLPLALWLEADRLKGLDVTPQNFENQRKVVQEEYRMRVSNAAYVPAHIRLKELVFQGYWPYEHDTIGSMQDLEAASFEWVKAFHDAYYVPNRAVLAIAGDVEPEAALALVHRYFDSARRGENAPAYAPPPVPDQTRSRTAELEDPHAPTPAFFSGWLVPATREPDHYALELAVSVLTDGESSRLYQKLVRDLAVAQKVFGWTGDHRGPDLVALEVQLTGAAKLGEVERLVDRELQELGRVGPTEPEMRKLRNRVQAGLILGLQSNLSRAIRLGQYELYWGDARLLNAELGRYLGVSRGDIQRVVNQYLTPARRTLVEVRPVPRAEQRGK
jgi:predicted Zn-dependent peptidase